MKRFLLIDSFEGSQNGFDEGLQTFETLDEVRKHLLDTAENYTEYDFAAWSGGLEIFEIARKVPLDIRQAVLVEFPEPPQPPTEPASDNVVMFGGERFGFRS